ncbi:alpha/beta fold hydrolase [Fischerella sp. PCC 9605]|uniref:alpha/beta fold hydrolase n=1 Tax=Fischerella sp. PCC 9605 TaxID=1173024 RepID=UPI00047A8F85|nr:alpha/beta hydrolase [Fischerella sp. PCC 9605]
MHIKPYVPEFLLFVQHGWADDNQQMKALARSLVTETTVIIAPNLGYIQTWISITPLIELVENIASKQIDNYSDVPIRIIGHSMGGLIWLEVLKLHPEWWSKIHSLVLIASPVGGADLGRIIDPFGLGIGIARDLGINRKIIAEKIAAVIPTLAIAGDIDGGSDGTIPVECTKFPNALFTYLPGLSHAALRNHPAVVSVISEFWLDSTIGEAIAFDEIIRRLHDVPGITDGHWRDFSKAEILMNLNNGGTIRTWRNLLGVDHVFVASPEGQCLYAGFVGWMHSEDLRRALEEIRQTYAVF